MASLHQTYTHIANILSFESDINNLRNDITNNKIDWDNLVKVASDHLVLTTVYCRLIEKSLFDLIPQELNTYLQELTSINRNRNETLIDEIKTVSNLFNQEQIDYVFLKGSALLCLNYYQDIGERMIGDIDILVDINQINKAKQILINNGYRNTKSRLSDKYQQKRHIPRLINDGKLAAIEIHSELLKKNHIDKLNAKTVLLNKQTINNVFVPANTDILTHNILGFQINDYGNYYNSFHFKHIYDGLILIKKHELPFNWKDVSFRKYFVYSSIYFNDFKYLDKKSKSRVLVKIFQLRAKHNWLNWFYIIILKKLLYLNVLANRFKLFIINKNYRKDVLQTIKN